MVLRNSYVLNIIKYSMRKSYKRINNKWIEYYDRTHETITGADAKDQDKVIETMKAKFITEAGITPADAEKKWKDEKTALQATITQKETEGLTWNQTESRQKLDRNQIKTRQKLDRNWI